MRICVLFRIIPLHEDQNKHGFGQFQYFDWHTLKWSRFLVSKYAKLRIPNLRLTRVLCTHFPKISFCANYEKYQNFFHSTSKIIELENCNCKNRLRWWLDGFVFKSLVFKWKSFIFDDVNSLLKAIQKRMIQFEKNISLKKY